MGRPKIPDEKKRRPLTICLTPESYDKLVKWAERDQRTLSAMATFMIDHCFGCDRFEYGHVPTDQIHKLQGQKKK
jgi:hypothetical protein